MRSAQRHHLRLRCTQQLVEQFDRGRRDDETVILAEMIGCDVDPQHFCPVHAHAGQLVAVAVQVDAVQEEARLLGVGGGYNTEQLQTVRRREFDAADLGVDHKPGGRIGEQRQPVPAVAGTDHHRGLGGADVDG